MAKDPITVWTPHDVAEWLYMQNTKDDYTHTFLVHLVDGPMLLGLKREELLEWKVKPVDITTILMTISTASSLSSPSASSRNSHHHHHHQRHMN